MDYQHFGKLTSDYKLTSEINYYFQQTKDVGMAATDYSFVSEHQNIINSLISEDTIKIISEDELSLLNQDYKPVNAKEYIVKRAKDHEFLLFNEAHFIPQHRNFVASLLDELSKVGYQNLALEGLNNSDAIVNSIIKKGYPELNHGYYIKEPEFGNLIREAQLLGYNIFGYDGGSGGEREISGAKNIITKATAQKNKGKTVVLCGWDHIKEGPTETYWEFALAGRIKEFSGNDPLTINQTQYSEKAKLIYEDSLYQAFDFKEPTIMVDKFEKSLDLEVNEEWYDVFVFHPRTKFEAGIPSWILDQKELTKFKVQEVEINYPCKIFLFEINDNIHTAVPSYIKEMAEKRETIEFPTKHNMKYKLLITDKENSYLIK